MPREMILQMAVVIPRANLPTSVVESDTINTVLYSHFINIPIMCVGGEYPSLLKVQSPPPPKLTRCKLLMKHTCIQFL